MLIKSWEKTKGKEVNYIYLYSDHFVIGNHYGSGHTDNAGQCTVKEFLGGRFQDLIIKRFGKKVLEEILLLIKQEIPGRDKNELL